MKNFDFRLQKVLEYREMLEKWSKDTYLDARAARLEAEVGLSGIDSQRESLLADTSIDNLEDIQTIDLRLNLLDNKALHQQTIIQVLRAEEQQSLESWTEKKQELEALVKLKEKAYAEWEKEMGRTEQLALDEWTNHRRAA
ncbi:MAG: flagellar FliJ family protein [Fimbriimonadaceae bacterium]